MNQQSAVQTERGVFHAMAYAATPLAIIIWLSLPRLTLLFFGGGHPSGDAIGALLALALVELLAVIGLASAFQQLRTTRTALLFATLAANTLLLAAPIAVLTAA